MSISTIIVLITSATSIYALQQNNILFDRWQFSAYLIQHKKEYHRFFTHALLHADWMHLIINMYVLYTFGNGVEENFKLVKGESGQFYFALFYVLSVVCSSIPSYEKNKNNSWYVSVGASGATSAIVFSYILFAPLAKFYFMFIPIGIPAIVFGIGYLIYSYYMSLKATDNIAHDVHFFGAIFGVLFTLALDKGIFMYFVQQLQF